MKTTSPYIILTVSRTKTRSLPVSRTMHITPFTDQSELHTSLAKRSPLFEVVVSVNTPLKHVFNILLVECVVVHVVSWQTSPDLSDAIRLTAYYDWLDLALVERCNLVEWGSASFAQIITPNRSWTIWTNWLLFILDTFFAGRHRLQGHAGTPVMRPNEESS